MQEKGIHDGAHQRDDNALQNFGENGSLGADAIFFHGQLLEFAVTCHRLEMVRSYRSGTLIGYAINGYKW